MLLQESINLLNFYREKLTCIIEENNKEIIF